MSQATPSIKRVALPWGGEVSCLCFGTLTMGPLQRNLPEDRGVCLLDYAYSKGINFLDTADIYGTYPYIRGALRGGEWVVATKSYAYDEKTALESFRRAVDGIGREYIDIFLLHEQESMHTLRGHARALEWLLNMKSRGAIGAVGISTHNVAAVRAAVRHGGLDVVHPLVNSAGLGIIGEPDESGIPPQEGARAQMEAAVAQAANAGLFIYGMKALGGGHLIGGRSEALRYALSLEGMGAVAVGMQSESEIDYNVGVFSGIAPDEKLAAAQRRNLLVHDWCEGCGKCVERCKSGAMRMEDGWAVVDATKCVLCGYCAAVCPQFCIKVI